jgi:DsbE subfamily thiol:disulfide oxidoreductase
MPRMKSFAAMAVATAMFAAAVLWAEDKPNATAAPSADKPAPAPAWTLKNLDGKAVSLSDFKGKVVILDFWATWCPPCRAEIPSFIELQKQYGNQGLAVIGLSLDESGATAVKKFVDKTGMNYTVVMADQAVAKAYGGVEAIPTTFVIDRQGHIINRHVGLTDRAEFEKEIKPLLKP